ncbi:hypothetical protein PUN28_003231 [Cardiocondyla obscurior]|uniref:Uncharacterized protein n=1 Tax=Cardiocondyla obscurior TaxID=286306 RepID=A0AAW2GHY5_9HYME
MKRTDGPSTESRQRDFALPPRLYRAEPCAAAAHRRSPAAATAGAATDASFPPPPPPPVDVDVAGSSPASSSPSLPPPAVAATAATDTVDRKEAQPLSLFPPPRRIRTRRLLFVTGEFVTVLLLPLAFF